jgi:hypothetical protein
MPLSCTFTLNSQEKSWFTCPGVGSVEAFSGDGQGRNNPKATSSYHGAIPRGRYWIVDRVSGGHLGWLYDTLHHRAGWFALYCDDDRIDDYMSVDGVTRSSFRLHPAGVPGFGVSHGCITVVWRNDFDRLHNALVGSGSKVVGGVYKAYGSVEVK